MFAVYDTDGLRFRDTLEKLRQVQPAIATTGFQLRSNVTEHETQPGPLNITGNTSEKIVSSKVQQAYKEMLHLNQLNRLCMPTS